jgi:hypothetical protein
LFHNATNKTRSLNPKVEAVQNTFFYVPYAVQEEFILNKSDALKLSKAPVSGIYTPAQAKRMK